MSDKKCPICGYELDSWNDCVSVNNILECPECEEHFELKAVTLNQPQLTIPKSIAEKTVGYFDKDIPNYFERSTRFVFSNWSSDLNGDNFDENEFDKRIQIVGAYLNPLTRDLVKVVADD